MATRAALDSGGKKALQPRKVRDLASDLFQVMDGDLLNFVAARLANKRAGRSDIAWQKE